MQSKSEIVTYNIQQYAFNLDLDYLVNISNHLSFAEFESIICQLLYSDDEGLISDICFAIRDLILIGNKYDELEEHCYRYQESSIVTAIESLLFAYSRQNVNDAIYTLGKTCSYQSVAALTQAFHRLRDRDPVMLPRLFCELQWLGAENFWSLVDSMMSSEVSFTRWSILELLPEITGDAETELVQQCYSYLDRLKQDPCEYIRIEADYQETRCPQF